MRVSEEMAAGGEEPLGKKGDVSDVEGSRHSEVIVAETARVVDHVAERKLCRKFDIRILPFLAVMCK
jgi:hypothetical protein